MSPLEDFKKIFFCKKVQRKAKVLSRDLIEVKKKRIYAYRGIPTPSTMVQKSVTSKDFGFAQRSYSCKILREVKITISFHIWSFQHCVLKITLKSLIASEASYVYLNFSAKNGRFEIKLKKRAGNSNFETVRNCWKMRHFWVIFQHCASLSGHLYKSLCRF